jgi:hypothetical protein
LERKAIRVGMLLWNRMKNELKNKVSIQFFLKWSE